MKEAQFVKRHRDKWRDFEDLLDEMKQDHVRVPIERFAPLYRDLCRHLSLARARGYSAEVTERLNPLVMRGHDFLYKNEVGDFDRILDYIVAGFARDVRYHWRELLLALAAFFGASIATFIWLRIEPEWAYHILGPMADRMATMYSDPTVRDSADSDVAMFGFYIYNNVGIALRTFAAGIFAGLGSLFMLGYNAIVLSAAAAHVTNVGYGQNFWSFVIGHGSFELTAIALAGQTGLRLGLAPIWPGRRSRMRALREAAQECAPMVLGVATMLVIAAFIEAFWSASEVPVDVKYTVGTGLWLVVILYFAFAGRR